MCPKVKLLEVIKEGVTEGNNFVLIAKENYDIC